MLLFCKSCSKKISKDAKFCPGCGDADPFFEQEFEKKTKETNSRVKQYHFEIVLMILLGGMFGIGLLTMGKWWSIILGLLSIAGAILEINEKREDIKYCKEDIEQFTIAKNHYNKTGKPLI
jgi:hypothetical protein